MANYKCPKCSYICFIGVKAPTTIVQACPSCKQGGEFTRIPDAAVIIQGVDTKALGTTEQAPIVRAGQPRKLPQRPEETRRKVIEIPPPGAMSPESAPEPVKQELVYDPEKKEADVVPVPTKPVPKQVITTTVKK